ncbi:MAG: hypothetical protein SV598_13310 [Pseudomonadota bacterium]|nr:hypothetical protein [Pseudomonadota bacterium]
MSGGQLEGKAAIVTGGGRGPGRAMVLGLAALSQSSTSARCQIEALPS